MAVYWEYIRMAFDAGFVATVDGEIIDPAGKLRKAKLYGKQRYATLCLTNSVTGLKGRGKSVNLPYHKFIAYFWYGEEAFTKVVRHIDGNTLNHSKTNIALGTYSENEQDKSKETRTRVGKHARAMQGLSSPKAKLSPEQVVSLRQEYGDTTKKKPNGFVKKLADKYSVTTTTIRNVATRRLYTYVD